MKNIFSIYLAFSLLTGCAAAPSKPDAEPQPMTAETPQLFDTTSPAGAQLNWVLNNLSEGATVTLEALDEHFDASFKAQVPPAQLQQVFGQLATGYGPLTLTQMKAELPTAIVVQAKTKTDELWLVSITTQAEAPHLITGLLFQPDPTTNEEALPKSWAELEEDLIQASSRPTLYVAKIDQEKLGEAGQCHELHAVQGDAQQALGSGFKLYILGALSQQIDEGKFSWDQEITIKDELKSLPSGVLQDTAAGAKVTIKEVATKMISISDNTATDHLLNLVGRENVEAWVRASGHSAPERLAPFLGTGELFKMKLGHDAVWRTKYIQLSEPERRKTLLELAAEPLPAMVSIAAWTEPRNVDTIEWFASGQDLCSLHATLLKHKDSPAYKTALEIMAINNAGVPLDPAEWPYIGFKGGSEPGVLFLSFLLQNAQGDWYSVSVGGSDNERLQDAGPYIGIVTAIFKNLMTPSD